MGGYHGAYSLVFTIIRVTDTDAMQPVSVFCETHPVTSDGPLKNTARRRPCSVLSHFRQLLSSSIRNPHHLDHLASSPLVPAVPANNHSINVVFLVQMPHLHGPNQPNQAVPPVEFGVLEARTTSTKILNAIGDAVG